jgi:hypothetical protein
MPIMETELEEKPKETKPRRAYNKDGTWHPRPQTWVKGKTGNPTGRPKEGESWTGVIKRVSNMTADEIAEMVGKDNELGQQLMQLPKGVAMKELVTARVLTALMFEPTPGLWTGLMERAEGRVPLSVDITTLALDAETVERKILELYERAKTRALLEAENTVEAEIVEEK